jgi:hypothetical protein
MMTRATTCLAERGTAWLITARRSTARHGAARRGTARRAAQSLYAHYAELS